MPEEVCRVDQRKSQRVLPLALVLLETSAKRCGHRNPERIKGA